MSAAFEQDELMTSMVLFTGAPGSGKSTLADSAASALTASVLAWDWVMGSLTPFDDVQAVFRQMDREQYRAVGWSVIWNLSVAQLRSGRSVVLDGVARGAEIARFREIAEETGARSIVVWTMCSDRDVHRSRIEGRVRSIPGWHELNWSHVDTLRSSLAEPPDIDLRLDAVDPIDLNVSRLLARLTA
jgi:predicted kinase